MPKLAYARKRLSPEKLDTIRIANRVLTEYAEDGYDLTLRQLYYQFVAKDLFPDDRTWRYVASTGKWTRDPNGTKNAEPNYNWLGDIVNDARMTGRIDWHHIVDRTRSLRSLSHWEDPAEIVDGAAKSFRIDLWAPQRHYVEVWIEKDALIGVIERVCNEYDLPYFSCRGYTSQSEMWGAAQRLLRQIVNGKSVTILHLGDHDPSGIDMTRDIEDRLALFLGYDYARHQAVEDGMTLAEMSDASAHAAAIHAVRQFSVKRLALNMDQIEQYDPPPNPAKITDSRARGYIAEHGNESWELDALEPTVLADLVRDELPDLIDDDAWAASRAEQQRGRKLLAAAAERWDELAETIEGE